ncbi:MAG: hypothetical protein OJF62_001425 [Pseudolabrys sp.]|nr:hypothetical protein [Pseudolabrys sp.]
MPPYRDPCKPAMTTSWQAGHSDDGWPEPESAPPGCRAELFSVFCIPGIGGESRIP